MTDYDSDGKPYDWEKGPLIPRGPVVNSLVMAIAPFIWSDPYYICRPYRPFKPQGLAIWNAPPGATLEQAIIGNMVQVVASFGGIPCRFFAYGDSYEQICKKLDEGLQPPAWGTWDTVSPGLDIRLKLEKDGQPLGPDDGIELCMWGRAVVR